MPSVETDGERMDPAKNPVESDEGAGGAGGIHISARFGSGNGAGVTRAKMRNQTRY